MGEVKRYDPDSSDATLREYVGGEWVTYIDYATLEAEREALRAKVAKLSAAAAQMREALRQAATDLRTVGDDYPETSYRDWCWSRADAADSAVHEMGRNYVDASGAVEGVVHVDDRAIYDLPDSWAGLPVLVMVKP